MAEVKSVLELLPLSGDLASPLRDVRANIDILFDEGDGDQDTVLHIRYMI